MKALNAPAGARRTGMGANFVVVGAVSTTKPAAMVVAVSKRVKILKNSVR